MFFDFFVLGLAVLALFKGLQNGLVVGIFSFLASIAGLAAALKFSAVVAGYIGRSFTIPERWLPFIAFAVVFLLVVFLIRMGAKAIEKFLQLAMLGWLNRLGGVVLYMLVYFCIFSVLLFYAVQLKVVKPEALQSSVTYPFVRLLAPEIMNIIGHVFPFFKNLFAQLEQFFHHIHSPLTK
jgi:membrane protein required for colicin V production